MKKKRRKVQEAVRKYKWGGRKKSLPPLPPCRQMPLFAPDDTGKCGKAWYFCGDCVKLWRAKTKRKFVDSSICAVQFRMFNW